MVRGEGYAPSGLCVCGERLAFIGPLNTTVTLLDTNSLDEVCTVISGLLIC